MAASLNPREVLLHWLRAGGREGVKERWYEGKRLTEYELALWCQETSVSLVNLHLLQGLYQLDVFGHHDLCLQSRVE